MKYSLQELLLHLPLHQFVCITSIPQEKIYYDTVKENICPDGYAERTLLLIKSPKRLEKLKKPKIYTQIVQDINFVGLVICAYNPIFVPEELKNIFEQCKLPIIVLMEPSLLTVFKESDKCHDYFQNISYELNGFVERGFTKIATHLARFLNTPILYLNSDDELIWETGDKQSLRDAKRWMQTYYKNQTYYLSKKNQYHNEKKSIDECHCFEAVFINIAGLSKQTFIFSNKLVDWQKRLIDKFVGLTALLIQTEELLLTQYEQIKTKFVYELLYHKFDSRKEMIRTGKKWGWNLENPHHLLIVEVQLADDNKEINWLEKIQTLIKEKFDSLIVFPFEGEIVILVEEKDVVSRGERKKFIVNLSNKIQQTLSRQWKDYQFHIGIGDLYEDTTYLNKSYQEAKLALNFIKSWFDNKNVIHIQELGVLQLFTFFNKELLYDYIKRYLGVLIACDNENESDYIYTLKLYFKTQGKINEMSDILYIHPNTIRYRLNKVEELTGLNLKNANDALNLEISVRLYYFLESY